MYFREVDIKMFKSYKETKLQKVLCDFAGRDISVAEVVFAEDEYKSPLSAYSALKAAIVRMKMGNVNVKVIDKKVYLINKVLFEKALQEVEKCDL